MRMNFDQAMKIILLDKKKTMFYDESSSMWLATQRVEIP